MDFLLPLAMMAVGSVLSNGLLKVPRPKRVDVVSAKQSAHNVRPIIPYRAPVPYTGGRVRALFIGINYTGSSNQLSGCVNDVHQMLGTLQRIGFPISECCILVDDPKFPNVTAYPTRENMVKYLAWLTHDVRPGDVLFLHYSGHGGQTKGGSDSEEEYDQTLVPLDFQQKGCILDDDLFIMLVKYLPAGVRMTCVFDCCHSATMLDLPFSFIATRQVAGGRTGYCMKPVRRDNYSNGDVLMFSGCDDAGTSADVRDTGRGNAGGAATQAFTWALLNTSGLSIMDMMLKTREILKQKKFKQVPQLTASKPVDLYKPFSLFGTISVDQQQMQMVPQQYRNIQQQQPPPPQQQQQPWGYPQQGPPPPPQQQQQAYQGVPMGFYNNNNGGGPPPPQGQGGYPPVQYPAPQYPPPQGQRYEY